MALLGAVLLAASAKAAPVPASVAPTELRVNYIDVRKHCVLGCSCAPLTTRPMFAGSSGHRRPGAHLQLAPRGGGRARRQGRVHAGRQAGRARRRARGGALRPRQRDAVRAAARGPDAQDRHRVQLDRDVRRGLRHLELLDGPALALGLGRRRLDRRLGEGRGAHAQEAHDRGRRHARPHLRRRAGLRPGLRQRRRRRRRRRHAHLEPVRRAHAL